MRLEGVVVEREVARLLVVLLERQVVVAQEALRDHEVVRLVALRSDLDLRAAGHQHVKHEDRRKEDGARDPGTGLREQDRASRQDQGQQGWAREGCDAREASAAEKKQRREREAQGGCKSRAPGHGQYQSQGAKREGGLGRVRQPDEESPGAGRGAPEPEEDQEGEGDASRAGCRAPHRAFVAPRSMVAAFYARARC